MALGGMDYSDFKVGKFYYAFWTQESSYSLYLVPQRVPWRGPMALPRDGNFHSGRVFDTFDTPGRCVNTAAAIGASAMSSVLWQHVRAPPLGF